MPRCTLEIEVVSLLIALLANEDDQTVLQCDDEVHTEPESQNDDTAHFLYA